MLRWNLLQTLSHRLDRLARGERGQALVEFALVLPVLILIIIGILYFGRYMNYSNQQTQLAEEGVRWAAVNVNPGTTGGQTLQAYIVAQAPPELQAGSGDVSPAKAYIYYPAGSSNVVGNALRVCIVTTVNYPFIGITGSTVAQSATMRIEVANTSAFTVNAPPSACPA